MHRRVAGRQSPGHGAGVFNIEINGIGMIKTEIIGQPQSICITAGSFEPPPAGLFPYQQH